MKYRPEYDMAVVGRNLRRLREANGYTVEDVREYLRMGSVQAVYKYEQGKSYPPADTMFALMQLYGASVHDIVDVYEEELGASSADYMVDGVVIEPVPAGIKAMLADKRRGDAKIRIQRYWETFYEKNNRAG